MLLRNIRIEEDLIDQLFNSSEKRLARTLLRLARYGKQDKPARMVATVSNEALAALIGTTRERVEFFLKKFQRLGFIDHDGQRPLTINNSLLGIVLHDCRQLVTPRTSVARRGCLRISTATTIIATVSHHSTSSATTKRDTWGSCRVGASAPVPNCKWARPWSAAAWTWARLRRFR